MKSLHVIPVMRFLHDMFMRWKSVDKQFDDICCSVQKIPYSEDWGMGNIGQIALLQLH